MRVMNMHRIVVSTAFTMAAGYAVAFAAPPAVDPCKVVTTAEIEQTVGKLKGSPQGSKEGVEMPGRCDKEVVLQIATNTRSNLFDRHSEANLG